MPTRLSLLIADDEPPARRRVRALLDRHPDVQVAGEVGTGREAIQAIQTLQPDAVFLDVQMPDGDGFEVVRSVGVDRMPIVVFATAYDEHALAAFEARALDYLLKPFDRERFDTVLDRVRRQLEGDRGVDARLVELLDQLEGQAEWLDRLPVRMGTRIRLIPVEDIDAIESQANYVRLHIGATTHVMRATLASLEAQLNPRQFVRVHRSLVVNVGRVVEVEPLASGGYALRTHDGQSWTSSRTFRARVEEAFHLRS